MLPMRSVKMSALPAQMLWMHSMKLLTLTSQTLPMRSVQLPAQRFAVVWSVSQALCEQCITNLVHLPTYVPGVWRC